MKSSPLHTNALKLAMIALVAAIVIALAPAGRAQPIAATGPLDNVVLAWNLHAVNAFSNPATAPTPGAGQPPQVSILQIAMVQGAIYDAVNTIDGGYQPYATNLPVADPSASKAAAVATAAHHVIVGVAIVPALSPAIVERVDALWAESIAAAIEVDGQEAVDAGIAAGEAAATAMLDARADDGRFDPFTIEAGAEPGDWRPIPPATGGDPNAWVGRVDPFLLENTSQFRSKGPRALNSQTYLREYKEVKKLGAVDSQRSGRQEAIAQFFMVNPVELYNRAFRTYSESKSLTIVDQARLFAMLNMAGADALINCFDDKIHYNFWRPITAIRLGNEDGNPKTDGDPEWTPLVGTPAYSDHSSGYNCVTAAFMHTAEVFFGKGTTDFSLVRIVAGVDDVTRNYKRFTDVIADTIDARVYQGIHFRTSDVQGAKIGKNVADWLGSQFFQPVK